jgi:non-heme chloroperoxidase
VALTFEQFRYGFGNAVSQDEARQLYEQYHVAGSGIPIFQAAFANFNPRTEARADKKNPDRGPMLIIGGEKDHQVPWAIANATYKEQSKNPGVTEVAEIRSRGHSLTFRQRMARSSPDLPGLHPAIRLAGNCRQRRP